MWPCAISPLLRKCDAVQWVLHRLFVCWAPWAFWASWALLGCPYWLMGLALVGPLGRCGPPWALMGRVLVAPLGPRGLGPYGLPGPLWPRP